MRKADGTVHGVYQVQGHAVRVQRDQRDAGHVRDQAVHIPVIPFPDHALSRILPGHPAHMHRMGLPG